MIYYSSPYTFIFKYIFPLASLIGGTMGFIMLYNSGIGSISYIAYAFGLAFLWNLIFIVQMPFRLKRINADENGINIISRNGDKHIPFQDIVSVRKFDMSNPWMVTIRFSNSNKEEFQKTSFLPNSKYQRPMKEDEMSEYIIDQAKAQNPNFEESSMLKNVMILFLAGLPVIIGMIYFINKSGAFNM